VDRIAFSAIIVHTGNGSFACIYRAWACHTSDKIASILALLLGAISAFYATHSFLALQVADAIDHVIDIRWVSTVQFRVTGASVHTHSLGTIRCVRKAKVPFDGRRGTILVSAAGLGEINSSRINLVIVLAHLCACRSKVNTVASTTVVVHTRYRVFLANIYITRLGKAVDPIGAILTLGATDLGTSTFLAFHVSNTIHGHERVGGIETIHIDFTGGRLEAFSSSTILC